MKKQLYIFTFAIAMMTTVNAFDQLTMFDETNEESKWAVIEKVFITDINEAKQSFWKHLSGVAVSTLIAGGAYQTYNANPEAKFMDSLQLSRNFYCLGTLAMGGLLATQTIQCHLSNQTNRNAVTKFFGNWDKNQFYTPAALKEAFDIIAETMELEGNEATLKNADEIIDTIQFIIMRHFEKRYEKVLQFTAATALSDTKTAGEILKNAVETTVKMSGK